MHVVGRQIQKHFAYYNVCGNFLLKTGSNQSGYLDFFARLNGPVNCFYHLHILQTFFAIGI